MSKRLRRLALISLTGTILLAVALAAFHRQLERHDMEAVWAEQNLILARSLTSAFRAQIEPLLEAPAAISTDALLDHPHVRRLGEAVRLSAQELRVVAVTLISPEGRILFSTESGRIGARQPIGPDVATALSGRAATDRVRIDSVDVADEPLLETHVPVRNDSGAVIGVLELQTNVSSLLQPLAGSMPWVIGGLFAILGGFYAMLVALYARTDRALQKEQAATQGYLKELEAANATLEERVAERTREAQESGSFLRSVMDCVPLPVVVIDKEYRLTAVNKAAAGMLPAAGRQNEPLHCYQAAHHRDEPCDGIAYPCTLRRVMETGQPTKVSHTHFLPDGTARTVEVWGSPLRDARGELTGIVEVCHDITERERAAEQMAKAKEEAEAASAAKSRFLATMSHELRTPLTTVIGMTEVLDRTALGRGHRDYLDTIRQSGQALLSMIDDILDLSRIAAGKHKLVQESFELDEVLDKVLDILAYQAYQKGLELILDVGPEVPARLWGFPTALRQVLLNIVGNAVKFTDEGDVSVRVGCARRGAATCLLRFEVSDTGIGIPEDQAGRLFEPFVQAEASPTRKQPGVGLGLSICRSLIKLMSDVAELHFSSRPGGGTCFSFNIDFSVDAQGRATSQDLDVPLLRGRPLLVAEGHAHLRETLCSWLDGIGVCPQTPVTAQRVLQQMRQAHADGRPFDPVIIGVGSGGLDGYDLARTIRGDRLLAGTRLLMLVPPQDTGVEALQREIGFEQYLRKPVRQARLLAAVQAVAESRPVAAGIETVRNAVPQLDGAVGVGGSCPGSILLVEDHPVNRQVLAQMLGSLGYAVQTAATGAEALQALEERAYSLVMLDCQLPDMNGSEVTQQIRRREGSGRRTPVVAVTALALAHERERCLAAGMDDYLTKPVTFDSLQRVLKQWLGEGVGGARTAAADGALLDSELWHQYRQAGTFDPDFIPRLVDLFVAHTRAQLAELRQAVAADDRSEIARLAHAMKGACNQVGAQRMAELLGSLVTSVREARGDVLSPLVEQLAEEQQRVSMELSAVKQNGVRAV